MKRSFLAVVPFALVTMLTVTGFAKPKVDYVPKTVEAAKAQDIGWDARLTIAASTSLAHNRKVVGQVDGGTFTLGAQLTGGIDYIRRLHEWRNSLKISETITRTPVIDEFVKTTDVVKFDSIYLFKIPSIPWLGPFARFQLDMQAFAGYDVRAGDVTYLIAGAPPQTASKLRLTDPYKPLVLKETLGLFGKPYIKEHLTVELKLGFQVRETFADGQFALDDNDKTPEIEIKPLSTFVQGGPSFGVRAVGTMKDKSISYYFDAETMMPVLNDSDESATALLNVSIEAGVSFKLFPWMSFDYQLRMVREPQLLDEFQVQNNFLLSFSYALLTPKAKPKK